MELVEATSANTFTTGADQTPVSPVGQPLSPGNRLDFAPGRAGGLLGSPRPETPVSPVASVGDKDSARRFFERLKVAETEAQQKRAELRASVFSIMQYERHADTGEVMVTQDQIDHGLAMGSIKRHAYAWHDLDRFDDVEAADQRRKGRRVDAGDLKPRHVHVVIACDHDYSIRQISDWLMIPSARVTIPKELAGKEGRPPYAGRGAREKAFFDFCQYLTHEGSKQRNKHQYSRDVVVANFDFGGELDDHMAGRAPGGKSSDSRKLDALMLAVMHGETTLRRLRQEYPLEYAHNLRKFHDLRRDFMLSSPPPSVRVNYYIHGPSGSGKSVLARMFARALYPDLDPEECYYDAGDPKVMAQNYGGQPVMILDDYRPKDLIFGFGSRTSVWRAFDTSPGRADVNIKHGAVRMVQAVNIVTGVVPYREFLTDLAGSYKSPDGTEYEAEDDRQAFRRFPFVAEVTSETFDFYANEGYFDGTDEYRQFRHLFTMKCSLRQLAVTLDSIESEEGKAEFRAAVGDRVLGGMIAAHRDVRPKGSLRVADAIAGLDAVQVLTGVEMETDRERRAIAAAAVSESVWDVPREVVAYVG